jgi:hypothetical protein
MPKVRRPIRAILFHNAAENQIDPGERGGRGGLDLRNPAVNGAIAGFRRPEQVDPIMAAANLVLDKPRRFEKPRPVGTPFPPEGWEGGWGMGMRGRSDRRFE